MPCQNPSKSVMVYVSEGYCPYLFNIYMDDLSKRLNECKSGCINGMLLLNLMTW